ncbi:MAG: thioredoxin family protein [Gemmatimonadetes bacterium]|jgi:peroxiredoxin|nr:thioredoxin family protein [Gemmatimonadota bacterium]
MSRSHRPLVPALLLVVLLAGAAWAAIATIDEKAPDFELQGADGKTYRLADFKGKHVVLEWVNFGCPFVRKHYDSGNMQQLQQTYTDSGVVWLSISSSAPGKQGHYEPAALLAQLKTEKVAHTAYLIDEDGKVGKLYGARTTPHMYVISPEGKLVYAGGIDDIKSANVADIPKAVNFVAKALDGVLAGQEVTQKTTPPYGCSVKYAN